MITIVGAGRVGSSAAFDILRYKISDVVLIDTNEKLAKGEALDMMQAAPAIEFDGCIFGTSDFREMSNSELVIVTAGAARRADMTRLDLIKTNSCSFLTRVRGSRCKLLAMSAIAERVFL